MTIYRVSGPRAYRGHAPGLTFEATIDPEVEARGVRFGAIEILERSTVTIRPGSYTLPRGWAEPTPSHR